MKKRVFNLLLIAGLASCSVACKNDKNNEVQAGEAREVAANTEEAAVFEIDTTASGIIWRGTKPTGEHRGTIDVQNGEIMATPNMITGGKVIVDMHSIAVTDEGMDEESRSNLENHLKGTVEGKETDFFNVNKFPTAIFEITGLTENNGKKMLQGNLTIKEDTKHIEFPVTTKIEGDMLSIKSEAFIIDRTDWKVNYRSKSAFENLGDKFISDDMELTIDVKAKKM